MCVNVSAKGNILGRGQEEERPSFPASRPQKSN